MLLVHWLSTLKFPSCPIKIRNDIEYERLPIYDKSQREMHTENRGFAGERIDKSEADRAVSSEIKLSVRKVPRPEDRKNRMDETLVEQLRRFNPKQSKSGSLMTAINLFPKGAPRRRIQTYSNEKASFKRAAAYSSLSLHWNVCVSYRCSSLSLSLFLLVENWRNAEIVTREYRTKGKDLLEVGRRQPYGWNTGRGGDCQEIGPF